MRTTLLIAWAALLFVAAQASAQRTDNGKSKVDMSTMVDDMAKQVFEQADRNHNGLLSKREFADAETLLDAHVSQWVQTRTIGKPKAANAKDSKDEQPPSQSAEKSGNKLAKSNKVTQAEFTFYVHAVVTEADEHWRQYNTLSDAQRQAYAAQQKAYNAQRAAIRNSRRMPHTVPVPYLPY
jgi:hypothetical protein